MRQFLFSPINTEQELLKAIEYVHFACHKLCKRTFGKYLPVAGNIGIFSHFDDEFAYLTGLREDLTRQEDNINHKYYRLHKPIIIPAKDDVPETTYYYLYIRRPEADHPQSGDVDFYLEPEKYHELKESILNGKDLEGVKIFERADLDLIKLFDPKVDASAFVGKNNYVIDLAYEIYLKSGLGDQWPIEPSVFREILLTEPESIKTEIILEKDDGLAVLKTNKKEASLILMAVSKDHQKQGLGLSLLRRVEDKCKKKGGETIYFGHKVVKYLF